MKIHNSIGSKERFLEMFQGVNKIKLNEDLVAMSQDTGNIAKDAFDELVQGNLNIEQTNTQASNGENYIEIVGTDDAGNVATFKFLVTTTQGEQDGVASVDSAKIINLDIKGKGYSFDFPEGVSSITLLNQERGQEMITLVSEYVDTDDDMPDISEEMYAEAVRFIDKVPYKKGTEDIQTNKAYADNKPTNPDVRVKSDQLDKFVSETDADLEDDMFLPADDGTKGIDPLDEPIDFDDTEPVQAVSPEKATIINQAYDNLIAGGNQAPTTDDILREVDRLGGVTRSVEKTRTIPKGAEEFYESAEVNRYSNYSQDIDARLRKYAEQTGEDWVEVKRYFKQEADPDNMKSPNEALDIYFKLVDEFLTGEGITEELNHVVGDVNADDVVTQGYETLIPDDKKQQIIFKAAELIDADLGDYRSKIPREQYLAAVRKQAIELYRNKMGMQNEEGGIHEEAEKNDYPDQIGKKFKPKRQFPKKKKKPQSVVKLTEEGPETGQAPDFKPEPTEMPEMPDGEDTNQVPGGLADDKDPVDFDSQQVMIGMGIEMEHTDDPKIALEIAMDHLMEIPDYYTRLDKMEKEAEAEGGEGEVEISDKGVGSEEPVEDTDSNTTDELLGFKPHNVGDYTNEEMYANDVDGHWGDDDGDEGNDVSQEDDEIGAERAGDAQSGADDEYFDRAGPPIYEEDADPLAYQGEVGDRFEDGKGNQLTVKDTDNGDDEVVLQSPDGDKEIANQDIQYLKQLGEEDAFFDAMEKTIDLVPITTERDAQGFRHYHTKESQDDVYAEKDGELYVTDEMGKPTYSLRMDKLTVNGLVDDENLPDDKLGYEKQGLDGINKEFGINEVEKARRTLNNRGINEGMTKKEATELLIRHNIR